MSYHKKKVFENNLEALRLAISYQNNNIIPSAYDIGILSNYKGWGGIKEVLFSPTDTFENNEDMRKYVIQLHEILDLVPTRKTHYLESIRKSTLTAFYTPPKLIGIIAQNIKSALNNEEFSFLDPSAGTGLFFDTFESHSLIPQSSVQIELDDLTALINSVKSRSYSNTQVKTMGFEESRLSDSSFNVIASNIPFANIPVFDPNYFRIKDKTSARLNSTKMVHNYFFVKSIDLLTTGGVLAFITSAGTLASKGNKFVREFIANNANIIGAYKLPYSMFAEQGIKQVDADLIIIQKTAPKKALSTRNEIFINPISSGDFPDRRNLTLSNTTNQFGEQIDIYDTTDIDSYFLALNENIGKAFVERFDLELFRAGIDKTILQNNHQSTSHTVSVESSLFDIPKSRIDCTIFIQEYYKTGTIVIQDQELYTLIISNPEKKNEKPQIEPLGISRSKAELLRSAIEVRDAYLSLLTFEQREQIPNRLLRDQLNETYDKHIKKFGYLNTPSSAFIIELDRQHFRQLLALEVRESSNYVKASIFREPTAIVAPSVTTDNELNISIALEKSLNKYGYANEHFIKQLMKISQSEYDALTQNLLFFNPISEGFEIKNKILTGNLYQKIQTYTSTLQSTLNESTKQATEKTIKFLEENLPAKLGIEQIAINLGARWLESKHYEAFFSNKEVFGRITEVKYNNSLDEFYLKFAYSTGSAKVADYGFRCDGNGRYYSGLQVAQDVMIDSMPSMNYTLPDGTKKIDKEAVYKWNDSAKRLKTAFQAWIKTYEHREEIVNKYNYLYNGYVSIKNDGSFLKFDDIHFKALNIPDLYNSQKNCIWKMILNEGGLVDHEVGGGKTLIMCATAHEAKRLGIAKKPIILCMKANVTAIAQTYRTAYPQDNILALDEKDMSKENRLQLFAKLSANNYDAVILTHDQFIAMPQDPQVMETFYSDMIEKSKLNYEESQQKDWGETGKKERKNLLKHIENLTVKLQKINERIKEQKDEIYNFKDFGFDYLIVDESHKFKNLVFTTRHNRIAGLGNINGSDRASNMMFACRSIQKTRGDDTGIVFLSGTPISNSITELYNIFSYLKPAEMKRMGMAHFDAWIANYSEKTVDFEQNVANQLVQKERFRRFNNVPELSSFYTQFADVQNAKMIGIIRPELDNKLITLKQNDESNEFTNNLMEFARTGEPTLIGRDTLTDGQKTAKMLMVTNLSKAMSLDLRMVKGHAEFNPNSKIAVCAKHVSELYKLSSIDSGVQLIFSDTGVGDTDWGFNAYKELRRILIETYDIPKSEIAFSQSAKSDKQKRELHSKVRNGEVRVFIGSTETMGTGVNVQDKIIAMHHLDIPWRPSDMEQRNGRGMRTGNLLAEKYNNGHGLANYIYATERTLDSYKFMLLDLKSTFINQIKTNSTNLRFVDEGAGDENNGMSFKEFQAIISGSGEMIKLARYEKEFRALEEQKDMHLKINNTNLNSYNNLLKDKAKALEFQQKTASDLGFYKSLKPSDEAVTELEPKNKNSNSIEICFKGITYTNVIDLGKHIIHMNEKVVTTTQEVGSIGNFKIMVSPRFRSELFNEYNERDRREADLFNLKGESFNHFSIISDNEISYTHNNGEINSPNPETAGKNFLNALDKIENIFFNYKNKVEIINKNIEDIKDRLNRPYLEEDKMLELITKMTESKEKIAKEMEENIFVSQAPKEEASLKNNFPKI
jgi:N12 class adenine-specific DNA methylase